MTDHSPATGQIDFTALTAQIVAAFAGNSSNSITPADVSAMIPQIHQSLISLGSTETPAAELIPAVDPKKSIKPSYLICLEDGKKMTMLKRYLRTHYGISPDEYRAKWGLPSSYPMVAPDYSDRRRDLAKANGLGRKPGAKRGRKPKVAAAS